MTRVALYGAPLAGQDEPCRLFDDAPAESVLYRVAVPHRGACPGCQDLLRQGAFALLMVEGTDCVAPWTHGQPA